MFYAFSALDIGSFQKSIGVGINIFDWIGIELGASDSGDISIRGNITPWLNFGINFGLSGISLDLGINTKSGNHEFSIGIGLAPIAIIVGVVTIIASGGQMINAVGEWFRQIFSF